MRSLASRHTLFAVLCLGAISWLPTAQAVGLEVSTTTVQMSPGQNAEGLTLNNSGAAPVRAQVRVFAWTQKDNADLLTPTTALTISPPMMQIAPGGEQLLRVIRTSAPAAPGTEVAYRLIIDELPATDAPPPQAAAQASGTPKTQLSFLMRYSLPVFIGATPSTSIGSELKWTIEKSATQWTVKVKNNAATRAQIADLSAVTTGEQRHKIASGLVGYALAGQEMEWTFPAPAGTPSITGYEAMINRATQALNVSAP